MANEQMHKDSHDLIMDFLESTKDCHNMSGTIKVTMCQFLTNVRKGLAKCAEENGGEWISSQQLIMVQIEVLRRCIVDLDKILNYKEVKQ